LIAELFQFPLEPGKDLPVAPLAYEREGDEPVEGKYLLRADPVCLVPGQHSLMLTGGDYLELVEDEVEQLIDTLNRHFSGQGMRFEAATPYHWYLILDEAPGITTTPYDVAFEQSIEDYLPQGERKVFWHAWLAEVQMLMHQWSGNMQRQLQNRPMINGVWPWGGGFYPLPAFPPADWQQVWSSDAFTRALATRSATLTTDVPVDGHDLLTQLDSPGHYLVQLPTPRVQAWDDLLDEWLAYVSQDWLAPMLEALWQKRIDRLTLYSETASFKLDRGLYRRWWRRTKPLQQWLHYYE
jgi:hypothetical protein